MFNDAIEALRVSYKKMNPFCVPFATTNMGSAMLAMDLVGLLYLVTSVLFYIKDSFSKVLISIYFCDS